MLTPYQKRQKDEDFTFDVFSVEIAIEKKEQKKEVKKRFQNKCVSSQKRRYKKRRGRHRSGYTYLLSLSWLTRLSFVGRKAVSTEEVQTIGKYS